MGVTIGCKNAPINYDLPYFGFFRLRCDIAKYCDEELGDLYKQINDMDTDQFNAKLHKLIKRNRIPVKIIDFCLQPDCDGKISFDTCRIIYERIKNKGKEKEIYGYAGQPNPFTFYDFKTVLQNCITERKPLIWY